MNFPDIPNQAVAMYLFTHPQAPEEQHFEFMGKPVIIKDTEEEAVFSKALSAYIKTINVYAAAKVLKEIPEEYTLRQAAEYFGFRAAIDQAV